MASEGNGNGDDGQHFVQLAKKQEHKYDHGAEWRGKSRNNKQEKSLELSSERRAVPTREITMTNQKN